MSTPDPGAASEERFIALETKLAYQEKLLAELNDVLFEHSKLIFELQKRAVQGEASMRDVLEAKPPNEKPPHY